MPSRKLISNDGTFMAAVPKSVGVGGFIAHRKIVNLLFGMRAL